MTFAEFGQELRTRRVERNISLSDIAADTRINQRFLEAIEKGQFDLLPQTYVRAFLREYASAVGLAPEGLIEQYAALRGEEAPPAPAQTRSTTAGTAPSPAGHKTADSARREAEISRQAILRPLLFGAFVIIAAAIAYVLLRTPEPPSPPSVTGGEIPFDRVIRETEAALPITDTAARFVAAPQVDLRSALPASDSLLLEMTTVDSVWVNIIIDNGSGNDYLFSPNRRRTWKARERFVVTMGNAGGATFRLNGKELGALGRRGAVLRNSVITSDLLR